jgi:hypothetical protein
MGYIQNIVLECTKAVLRLQQQATSAHLGFSAYVKDKENETFEALTNLATAQAADCQAFCNIVTTNLELAKQLRSALSDISSLKNLVLNKQPRKPRQPTNSYCWTHSVRVAKDHTSKTCKNQREGHQTGATKKDMMGGSIAGQSN